MPHNGSRLFTLLSWVFLRIALRFLKGFAVCSNQDQACSFICFLSSSPLSQNAVIYRTCFQLCSRRIMVFLNIWKIHANILLAFASKPLNSGCCFIDWPSVCLVHVHIYVHMCTHSSLVALGWKALKSFEKNLGDGGSIVCGCVCMYVKIEMKRLTGQNSVLALSLPKVIFVP